MCARAGAGAGGTRLAMDLAMRSASTLFASALATVLATVCPARAWASPATAPALVDVEGRAGFGVEIGGAGGAAVVRPSAMTVGARAAYAINESPATWAYVGGMTETGGR